jgi:hypothetical protein
MRQRLPGFLPILLIALMVQILAPVGATWTAAMAAADPLGVIEICHSGTGASPSQGDPGGQHGYAACVLCCVTEAVASLDVPPPVAVSPPLAASHVVWHRIALMLPPARSGANANARGPPAAA